MPYMQLDAGLAESTYIRQCSLVQKTVNRMALNIEMNEERFLTLLGNLVGHTEYLQNYPPSLVPQEDLAVNEVTDVLRPYNKESGGPLEVEQITYVPKRSNLIITYNPYNYTDRSVGFVGSHFDVVRADPNNWNKETPPFQLTRLEDKLYGRGTTDCLGHVALITDLLVQLAEKNPPPDLGYLFKVVFIASEEYDTPGVGVEQLSEDGYLDDLKNGPVYWIDSSDVNPVIGSAGLVTWKLRANGLMSHSGFPNQGINAIEFGNEALSHIQNRFYQDFSPDPREKDPYRFVVASSMKPVLYKSDDSTASNQIPAWVEISGDVRLTPFYNLDDCVGNIQSYVRSINEDPAMLPTHGPDSKYDIVLEGVRHRGNLTFTPDSDSVMKGIACDLNSLGFKNLDAATREVFGSSDPSSVTGSLPLVGDMQSEGYDIQMCGYGIDAAYHADNEYCLLSQMKIGTKILSRLLEKFMPNDA